MGLPEYRIGVVAVGILFAAGLVLTVLIPTVKMIYVVPTAAAVQKAKDYGTESGWSWRDPHMLGTAAPASIGKGRTIYIREGCSSCHTQMPASVAEGTPPSIKDLVKESPTLFGSNRMGPDLLHAGSRYPERDWYLRHLQDPRNREPQSIMPSYDYLPQEELEALADYLASLE
jgi:cbb3-type cytochrome oxidase cytochrome c subunit